MSSSPCVMRSIREKEAALKKAAIDAARDKYQIACEAAEDEYAAAVA